MSQTTANVDRAALVRRALVELVATRGFRGASMAAVAERAGVATGTAYVHYRSKDDLVLEAYAELKGDLGKAALDSVDPITSPAQRFRDLWIAVHRHLANDPARARFLVQVESSPYATRAHEAALSADELLTSPELQEVIAALIPLPTPVLWDLGVGPAVRLAAGAHPALDTDQLELVAAACWRAVTGGRI